LLNVVILKLVSILHNEPCMLIQGAGINSPIVEMSQTFESLHLNIQRPHLSHNDNVPLISFYLYAMCLISPTITA
jgi:hypothetical protein